MDLIDRQAAIDAILAVTGNSSVRELYEHVQEHELSDMWSGGVNAAIDIIIAVPSAQPEKRTEERTETHACDLIDREAAVDAIYHHLPSASRTRARTMLHEVPSAQPEQRWNRLMMYLADLQLTYSPGWGANGQGDEKIYEFVTGLIDELQGWEEEAT